MSLPMIPLCSGSWLTHFSEAFQRRDLRTIIEFGAGGFSTPFISTMARVYLLQHWVIERDPMWRAFAVECVEPGRGFVGMREVSEFRPTSIEDMIGPAIALVDSDQPSRAADLAWCFEHNIAVIVAHDTEPAARDIYGWRDLIRTPRKGTLSEHVDIVNGQEIWTNVWEAPE